MHPAAKAHLFLVEARVVVAPRELNGVVFGVVSLQHDFTWHLAPPGAAGNLGQQLECALSGAEIGEAQGIVGAHNTHERDTVHVMPFRYTLSAHQQIDLTAAKLVHHPLPSSAHPATL